jgi:hypothetical protein
MPEDHPSKWTVAEKTVEWLLGQPFNNIMLVLIFVSIAYGSRYVITEAIPSHLRQIQEGYRELDINHRDERLQTQEWYERMMDRMEGKRAVHQP